MVIVDQKKVRRSLPLEEQLEKAEEEREKFREKYDETENLLKEEQKRAIDIELDRMDILVELDYTDQANAQLTELNRGLIKRLEISNPKYLPWACLATATTLIETAILSYVAIPAVKTWVDGILDYKF